MPLPPDLQLHLVETWEDAEAFMQWFRQTPTPILGCDTETGGLRWYEEPLRVIQFGDLQHGWALPADQWGGLAAEVFARWPHDYVFHNAKFDLLFLETNGYKVPRHRVHDSMLLARVVDPHLSARLKDASDRLVDSRASHMSKALDLAMMKHKWTWRTVPMQLPAYWAYAALDPVITVAIWSALAPRATGLQEPYQTDLATSMIVLDMELRGQMVDREYCIDWSRRIARYEREMDLWAHETFGVKNLNSDAEMIRFFQAQGAHLTRMTEKGNISLDKVALAGIEHPLANEMLQYRKANKRRTTYFDPWLRFSDTDDRIHPTFNISGARTARMSSETPNLQNVPRSRAVRRGLVPKPGHVLVLADYDQIELRLMAHFARSQPMINAIHDGEDLHSYTAKLVYGVAEPTKEQRRVAKHSNFAKIYGAGLAKFALTAEVELEEARAFLAGYDSSFPEVRQFQNEVSNQAHTSAAAYDDGLAHVFSEYLGRQQVADPREAYKLVNYIVQGTAADVLKRQMMALDFAGLTDHLTVPIHDELAFEVPTDEAEEFARELPAVMEDRVSFSVPLTVGVEIVKDWGEKYDEGT